MIPDVRVTGASAVSQARRGRKPKTEEEIEQIKEAMYAAARELLSKEVGLTVSLEELSMERVISDARVPRSAAYKIWKYKDEFSADFLVHLAGPDWAGTAAFDGETLRLASGVVLTHWDELDDEAGRRRVLAECVRIAVARNLEAIRESDQWAAYMALSATANGLSVRTGPKSAELLAALVSAETQFLDSMENFYLAMAAALGLQTRGDLTFRHIAAAGASIAEGLAVRSLLARTGATTEMAEAADALGELVHAEHAYPDGTQEGTWSLAAIAYMGMLDAMLEPIPGWKKQAGAKEILENLAAEQQPSR